MYNKKKIKVSDSINGAFPIATNGEANVSVSGVVYAYIILLRLLIFLVQSDATRAASIAVVSAAGIRESMDRSESVVSSSDNSSVVLPAKVPTTKGLTTDIRGSTDIETTTMHYIATSTPYSVQHASLPESLGITMSDSPMEELDALCDKCWDTRTAAKIELEVNGLIMFVFTDRITRLTLFVG